MTTSQHEIARSHWLRLWSAVPPMRIKAVAGELAERFRIDDLEIAQSGLGLLPLRDSALGEPYFLGEIPLARAHVRISNDQGVSVEGAAILLDDRTSIARALAIFDGVLAARLPGFEQAIELLIEGQQQIAITDSERKKLLAATRVDFSLLGSEEEKDDV